MTLSRKLTWKLVALGFGLTALAVTSLAGLSGLRNDVRLAGDEYRELRIIQDVDIHVAAAHGILSSPVLDEQDLGEHLGSAIERLEDFLAFQDQQVGADPQHQARELQAATAAIEPLNVMALRLDSDRDAFAGEIAVHHATIQTVLSGLEQLAVHMDRLIDQAHTSARTRLYRTLMITASVSAVIILSAVLINIWHYRSVMRPLNRLREASRRLASGDFSKLAELRGDEEFVQLAGDFNRMAGELDNLYRNLEEQVRTKSKELVRSERLASVGFLASGVAHEINNPLNIISGYAELSLRQLRARALSGGGAGDVRGLEHSLEIMLEEAFRCKRIIEQLLSLARTDGGERRPVHVADLVRSVAAMLGGLKAYRDRRLVLDLSDEDLVVRGSEAELKQVLLNLSVNALEAVDPVNGKVTLSAQHAGGNAVIDVIDNGTGMTAEVLDHVFEPFFTRRRETQRRGVGLGLAITHAIVLDHGGRVQAASDGPGLGSRFTVELPLVSEVTRVAS